MRNILRFCIFFLFSAASNANEIDVSIQAPSFSQKEVTVFVKNNKKFPQVVKIDISNNSSRADVIGTAFLTVPSESNIIQKVFPIEGKKFSNEVYFSYVRGVGDFSKNVERNGYQLPFDTNFEVSVCQFPHGVAPAIDFCAPKGTKIYAAKDGIVVWTVDKFGDGGADSVYFDKANFIEIIHHDGSRALYSHLEKNTLLVKEGQFVKKGDPIADVGLSGQTSGAHLHFHIVKINKDFKEDFVEPIFLNSTNQILELKNGYLMTRESSTPNIAKSPIPLVKEVVTVTCAINVNSDDKTKAVDCYSKNQYETAIGFFLKHVKKNPNDSLSLARLAISYTRLNRHEEALSAYKNAIAKNWISYDFASLYARSLFAMGEKEEAIKWSRRALVLAPTCNDCRRDLAIQLKELGRTKEALELLTKYDTMQKSLGKPQYFQGLIMLLEDEEKILK